MGVERGHNIAGAARVCVAGAADEDKKMRKSRRADEVSPAALGDWLPLGRGRITDARRYGVAPVLVYDHVSDFAARIDLEFHVPFKGRRREPCRGFRLAEEGWLAGRLGLESIAFECDPEIEVGPDLIRPHVLLENVPGDGDRLGQGR